MWVFHGVCLVLLLGQEALLASAFGLGAPLGKQVSSLQKQVSPSKAKSALQWQCCSSATRNSRPGGRTSPAPASFTRLEMAGGATRSSVKRALQRFRGAERTDDELRIGIAGFYDQSSQIWEEMWGEHMHHGYYVQGEKPKTVKDHKVAQVDMITRSLDWAGVKVGPDAPKTGVDIGCGIGGSSRHICRTYGTSMTGITLSPVQRQRAEDLTKEFGLDDAVDFKVMDALNTDFKDDSFDLVWSMESGEHMPNKPRFVSELARICAPNGKVLVVTWCHRDLEEGEEGLSPKEEKLLKRINNAYYLPRWCSIGDYVKLFEESGLTNVRREDWTDNVQELWPGIIKSAISFQGIFGLLKSGPTTLRGAYAMAYMVRGFSTGLIKFGLITGEKPSSP